MTNATEPHLSGVVRRVVVAFLHSVEDRFEALDLADNLENREAAAMTVLRERVDEADRAWSRESNLVAMRHDSLFWKVFPELVDGGEDGQLVVLKWGWGAHTDDPDERPMSLTITGSDAFDLAVDLAALFTDEDGEPQRPERPPPPEPPPAVSRYWDDFMELASELMKLPGMKDGCSLADVDAWVATGKPDEPKPHDYVEYPEDHVAICSVCGHWYYTDRDDFGTLVCWGEPLLDDRWKTIYVFDPRRSETLREAQRLQRLTRVMEKCEATEEETELLRERLGMFEAQLTAAERERYEKESPP